MPAVLASHAYTWRNVEIGGGGGFVDGILFHPKQPGLIYCRTDIGGVYRYDSRTKRWIPLTDWVGQEDGNLRGAESIAIDPTDPKRLYVAAGTYLEPQQKAAILRSDDQGRTFTQTPMPLEMGGNDDGRNIGERLVVDPNHPSTLLFGSRRDGLWRSDDYGTTFHQVTGFPAVPNDELRQPGQWRPPAHAGIGLVVFDTASGSRGKPTPVIYAGVDAPEMPGLYRSSDAGSTWQPVPGQPPAGMMPERAAIDRTRTMYITYGNALGPNGITDGAVYKYDTHTGAWKDVTPLKPDASNGRSGGYSGLSLDPNHPGTLVVSTLDYWNPGDDVFHTTDGGATWHATRANAIMDPKGAPWLKWGKPTPRFGWWTAALALDPFNPRRVLYGTGATIWGTDNILPADSGKPTTWRMYAEGIEETAVTALISPPQGAHLISGLGDIGGFTHHSLTTSPPEGMSSPPIFTTTSSLDYAENAAAIIVRVGSSGNDQAHGAYSADYGNTWTPFAAEPQGSRGSGSVALTADGKTIVWAAQQAPVSYSRDNGSTWSACSGLPQPASNEQGSYFGTTRRTVFADRVDREKVYVYNGDSLYVSTDGGVSFTQASANSLPSGKGDFHAVPGHTGDLWFSAGGDGLFHSTDAGASFTKLAGVATADGLAFGKAAPGARYPALYLVGAPMGKVHGVYRSTDSGARWLRINDDRHQYGWIGEPLAADPRIFGRVYLGTNGRGIIYGDPVK